MSQKKRDRDTSFSQVDEAVSEAVEQLQSTLERGAEQKLRALDKIISLVDQSDEQYSVQRALVQGDAAFYITELLSDPAPAVACKAAEAVDALCAHSAAALARLAVGPLIGLDNCVERVSLNPCQSDFVDSGALSALVPMLFQRQEAAREAATEAISALCSLNQEGKLAYLDGLVQALQKGPQAEAFELLDALIDGMECGSDEAVQQLELLNQPLLAELRPDTSGRRRSTQAALCLLATLCEKRPNAAAELRRAGAIANVAQHLLHGDQVVRDVAARALWLLAKGQRQCLSAAEGLLGCEALQLAQALIQLIEAADAEEARAQNDFGATEVGSEDGGDQAHDQLEAVTPTAADICHAEEASLLLRALAACYPDVEQLADEREVPVVRTSHCCIS